MIIWNPKDPGETVAYTRDLSTDLGADAISSFTLTVVSGDAVIQDSDYLGNVITALISGGTTGTTTTFLLTTTTKGHQVLEDTITLYVADDAKPLAPTTLIKADLVGMAFEECALNGWEYDITADEKETALRRLDLLMAQWKGSGIDIGYNAPSVIGGGDLNDVAGIPDAAVHGVITYLAFRLGPTMGKKLTKETNLALRDAMKAVRAAAVSLVPSSEWGNGTPLGSGNKPWSTRYPFNMPQRMN